MRNPKYTYQLAHGTGMINETLSLLSIYQEGMNKNGSGASASFTVFFFPFLG